MKEKSIKNYVICNTDGHTLTTQDGDLLYFQTIGEAIKNCIEVNNGIDDKGKIYSVIPIWRDK